MHVHIHARRLLCCVDPSLSSKRTCTSPVRATHEKVHYEPRFPLHSSCPCSTGIQFFSGWVLQCNHFARFQLLNSRHRTQEPLMSHTRHKPEEEEEKKRRKKKTVNAHSYKNAKKHLHFCKHNRTSTTPPPLKK